MVLYGLKLKENGKLLGAMYASINRDMVGFSLTDCFEDIPIWLVKSKEIADYARCNGNPDYKISYEKPEHVYSPDELEVVEINI